MIPQFCKSCLKRIEGKHAGYCDRHTCQNVARRASPVLRNVPTKELLISMSIPAAYRHINELPMGENTRLSFRASLNSLLERTKAHPYDDATLFHKQLKEFRRAASAESAGFTAYVQAKSARSIPEGDKISTERVSPSYPRKRVYYRGGTPLPDVGCPLPDVSTPQRIAIALFMGFPGVKEVEIREFVGSGYLELELTGTDLPEHQTVVARLYEAALPCWASIRSVVLHREYKAALTTSVDFKTPAEDFKTSAEAFKEAAEKAFAPFVLGRKMIDR